MDQTVLPLGQNLLEKIEKYNSKHLSFLYLLKFFFLKGQYGSTHISVDSNFQKMIETIETTMEILQLLNH